MSTSIAGVLDWSCRLSRLILSHLSDLVIMVSYKKLIASKSMLLSTFVGNEDLKQSPLMNN